MSAGTAESELDLEALFDRVAAERRPPEPAPQAAKRGKAARPGKHSPAVIEAVVPSAGTGTDAPIDGEPTGDDAGDGDAHMFRRIGQLTRTLHEALRELGYDRKLASAASTMPDARKRLEYIASLTARSADTVLEGVEQSQAIQQSIDQSAGGLGRRWQALYDGALSAEDFKSLAGDTREFLEKLHEKTAATQDHLHQIMMAQDFHDLTGQVIKKIVDVAHTVEASLVELLLETRATEVAPVGLLNGPVIDHETGGDTVSSQAQVDALLNSLGF